MRFLVVELRQNIQKKNQSTANTECYPRSQFGFNIPLSQISWNYFTLRASQRQTAYLSSQQRITMSKTSPCLDQNRQLPCLERRIRLFFFASESPEKSSQISLHRASASVELRGTDVSLSAPAPFSPLLPLTVTELLTENANRPYPSVTLSTHDSPTCPGYHSDTSSGSGKSTNLGQNTPDLPPHGLVTFFQTYLDKIQSDTSLCFGLQRRRDTAACSFSRRL